jgi:hypothetical protein
METGAEGKSIGFFNEAGSAAHEVSTEDLTHYGFLPELLGRLPVRVQLDSLSASDLVTILTQPREAMVPEYQRLCALDQIQLDFTPDALYEIANAALRQKLGARALRAILEKVLHPILFVAPERAGERITIETGDVLVVALACELRSKARHRTLLHVFCARDIDERIRNERRTHFVESDSALAPDPPYRLPGRKRKGLMIGMELAQRRSEHELGIRAFDRFVYPIDERFTIAQAAVGQAPFRQAIDATRPAGRIILFAATSPGETAELDLGSLCAAEKEILTSYSASVDVQDLAAQLVFRREVRVRELITHRMPLAEAARAVELASRPAPGVLKVVLQHGSEQRGESLAT